MNFKQFLTEMPITTFEKLGNWGEKDLKRGYSSQDIGILTSEKGIQKIKTKWERTPYNFDLYFLRSKEGYKVREVGAVNKEYLNNVLNIDIPINKNNITIIFTQNLGTEKIPMTAWAIAHRFGHAARRLKSYEFYIRETTESLNHILENYFNFKTNYDVFDRSYDSKTYQKNQNMLKKLAHALGTMKSAREGKLVNYNEFFHELFAQYLLTGKIELNIPKKIITNFALGNPQYQHVQNHEDFEMYIKDHLEPMIEGNVDFVLSNCVGKIFVM